MKNTFPSIVNVSVKCRFQDRGSDIEAQDESRILRLNCNRIEGGRGCECHFSDLGLRWAYVLECIAHLFKSSMIAFAAS